MRTTFAPILAIFTALTCLGVVGCQHSAPTVSPERATVYSLPQEGSGTALADTDAVYLSFAPAVPYSDNAVLLDRASRAQGAVVGYDSAQVTTFYLRQEDRHSSYGRGFGYGYFGGGYLDRRAYTQTVGVRAR